jgi:hypothetical protein
MMVRQWIRMSGYLVYRVGDVVRGMRFSLL